jgi:DNA repair exonuclease SbcCD ATPase subunit
MFHITLGCGDKEIREAQWSLIKALETIASQEGIDSASSQSLTDLFYQTRVSACSPEEWAALLCNHLADREKTIQAHHQRERERLENDRDFFKSRYMDLLHHPAQKRIRALEEERTHLKTKVGEISAHAMELETNLQRVHAHYEEQVRQLENKIAELNRIIREQADTLYGSSDPQNPAHKT